VSEALGPRIRSLLIGLAMLPDGATGSMDASVSSGKPGTREPKADSLYMHYERAFASLALIDYPPAREQQILVKLEEGEQALRRERSRRLPEMTNEMKHWLILSCEMGKRSDKVAEAYDVEIEYVEALRHSHGKTRRHGRDRNVATVSVAKRARDLKAAEPELSVRQIAAKLGGVSYRTIARYLKDAVPSDGQV